VVAAMLATHRGLGTWCRKVDVYIALSEFARKKFIQGGLREDRVVVKPNFVHSDIGAPVNERTYALFVGRLSEEKGLPTLINAWTRIRGRVPLHVVGDGYLRESMERKANTNGLTQVSFLGRLSHQEIRDQIGGARFLLVPSVWYEGFPMIIAEAFAYGLPVLCSGLGSLQEIVQDGYSGLHFNPGDPQELAAKVEWAWSHPTEMKEMGRAARQEYECKYTPERSYEALLRIYEQALRSAKCAV